MSRFNPFIALLYLMILSMVVAFTLLQDLFSYLFRLAKRIRKNFHYVVYGK